MAAAVMHEQVHKWAGQDQQPRQCAEDVRGVLGQRKKTPNYEKTEADDPNRGDPKRTVRSVRAA
jgi:hypothetical protein